MYDNSLSDTDLAVYCSMPVNYAPILLGFCKVCQRQKNNFKCTFHYLILIWHIGMLRISNSTYGLLSVYECLAFIENFIVASTLKQLNLPYATKLRINK